jgi:hypothetical protein
MMKLGTFIVGGMAGAMLAMMFQRNRFLSAIASEVGSSMKKGMSTMKDEAMQKAFNFKFDGFSSNSSTKERHKDRSNAGFESSGDLKDIGKLVAHDSDVKREVDAILEQSGQHRI